MTAKPNVTALEVDLGIFRSDSELCQWLQENAIYRYGSNEENLDAPLVLDVYRGTPSQCDILFDCLPEVDTLRVWSANVDDQLLVSCRELHLTRVWSVEGILSPSMSLVSLVLKDTRIHTSLANCLFVENPLLEAVVLDSCEVEASTAGVALVRSLCLEKAAPRLQTLRILGTHLPGPGLDRALMKLLMSGCLKRLHLEHIRSVGNNVAIGLGEAFYCDDKKKCQLAELALVGVSMAPEAAFVLCTALALSTSLSSLKLSGNPKLRLVKEWTTGGLFDCQTLETLDLQDCDLGQESVEFLKQGLGDAVNLLT